MYKAIQEKYVTCIGGFRQTYTKSFGTKTLRKGKLWKFRDRWEYLYG